MTYEDLGRASSTHKTFISNLYMRNIPSGRVSCMEIVQPMNTWKKNVNDDDDIMNKNSILKTDINGFKCSIR